MVESLLEGMELTYKNNTKNVNGDAGIYHGYWLDIVDIGCSFEHKNQETLGWHVEGFQGSASLNFAYYLLRKYCIEKPSLIIQPNKPPSTEVLESARKILQILLTIER